MNYIQRRSRKERSQTRSSASNGSASRTSAFINRHYTSFDPVKPRGKKNSIPLETQNLPDLDYCQEVDMVSSQQYIDARKGKHRRAKSSSKFNGVGMNMLQLQRSNDILPPFTNGIFSGGLYSTTSQGSHVPPMQDPYSDEAPKPTLSPTKIISTMPISPRLQPGSPFTRNRSPQNDQNSNFPSAGLGQREHLLNHTELIFDILNTSNGQAPPMWTQSGTGGCQNGADGSQMRQQPQLIETNVYRNMMDATRNDGNQTRGLSYNNAGFAAQEESHHMVPSQNELSFSLEHPDQEISTAEGMQQVKDKYQSFLKKLKAEQTRLNQDIQDLNQAALQFSPQDQNDTSDFEPNVQLKNRMNADLYSGTNAVLNPSSPIQNDQMNHQDQMYIQSIEDSLEQQSCKNANNLNQSKRMKLAEGKNTSTFGCLPLQTQLLGDHAGTAQNDLRSLYDGQEQITYDQEYNSKSNDTSRRTSSRQLQTCATINIQSLKSFMTCNQRQDTVQQEQQQSQGKSAQMTQSAGCAQGSTNQLLNNTVLFESLLNRSLAFEEQVLGRIVNQHNNQLYNEIQRLDFQQQQPFQSSNKDAVNHQNTKTKLQSQVIDFQKVPCVNRHSRSFKEVAEGLIGILEFLNDSGILFSNSNHVDAQKNQPNQVDKYFEQCRLGQAAADAQRKIVTFEEYDEYQELKLLTPQLKTKLKDLEQMTSQNQQLKHINDGQQTQYDYLKRQYETILQKYDSEKVVKQMMVEQVTRTHQDMMKQLEQLQKSYNQRLQIQTDSMKKAYEAKVQEKREIIETKNQVIKERNHIIEAGDLEVRTLKYQLDEFNRTFQENQQRYQHQISALSDQNENGQSQLEFHISRGNEQDIQIQQLQNELKCLQRFKAKQEKLKQSMGRENKFHDNYQNKNKLTFTSKKRPKPGQQELQLYQTHQNQFSKFSEDLNNAATPRSSNHSAFSEDRVRLSNNCINITNNPRNIPQKDEKRLLEAAKLQIIDNQYQLKSQTEIVDNLLKQLQNKQNKSCMKCQERSNKKKPLKVLSNSKNDQQKYRSLSSANLQAQLSKFLNTTKKANTDCLDFAITSSLDEQNFLRLISNHSSANRQAKGPQRSHHIRSKSQQQQKPKQRNKNCLTPERPEALSAAHVTAAACCIQDYKDTVNILEKENAYLEDEVKLLQKEMQEYQDQLKVEERKYACDMDQLKESVTKIRNEKEENAGQLQEIKEELGIETKLKNEGVVQIAALKETEERLAKMNHELQKIAEEKKLEAKRMIEKGQKRYEMLYQKYDSQLYIIKNKLHTLAQFMRVKVPGDKMEIEEILKILMTTLKTNQRRRWRSSDYHEEDQNEDELAPGRHIEDKQNQRQKGKRSRHRNQKMQRDQSSSVASSLQSRPGGGRRSRYSRESSVDEIPQIRHRSIQPGRAMNEDDDFDYRPMAADLHRTTQANDDNSPNMLHQKRKIKISKKSPHTYKYFQNLIDSGAKPARKSRSRKTSFARGLDATAGNRQKTKAAQMMKKAVSRAQSRGQTSKRSLSDFDYDDGAAGPYELETAGKRRGRDLANDELGAPVMLELNGRRRHIRKQRTQQEHSESRRYKNRLNTDQPSLEDGQSKSCSTSELGSQEPRGHNQSTKRYKYKTLTSRMNFADAGKDLALHLPRFNEGPQDLVEQDQKTINSQRFGYSCEEFQSRRSGSTRLTRGDRREGEVRTIKYFKEPANSKGEAVGNGRKKQGGRELKTDGYWNQQQSSPLRDEANSVKMGGGLQLVSSGSKIDEQQYLSPLTDSSNNGYTSIRNRRSQPNLHRANENHNPNKLRLSPTRAPHQPSAATTTLLAQHHIRPKLSLERGKQEFNEKLKKLKDRLNQRQSSLDKEDVVKSQSFDFTQLKEVEL